MFSYIIRANGMKALAVTSELGLQDLRDKVRRESVRLHPDSTDTVWRWGVIEFVNPEVMSPTDFAQFCPAIL